MQNRSDLTKLLAPSNLEGDTCSEISDKKCVIKMGKRVTRNQTSKANLAGTDMDGRVTRGQKAKLSVRAALNIRNICRKNKEICT